MRFKKFIDEEISTVSVPDGSGTETNFNDLIPDEKKGFLIKKKKKKNK